VITSSPRGFLYIINKFIYGMNKLGGKQMAISKREKMALLLEQLNMPKYDIKGYFLESSLEKLEVFKQSKTWHFHFQVTHLLPLDVYQHLLQQLKKTFNDIAEIDVTIYPKENASEDHMICDYWMSYVQTISDLSPIYQYLVHQQK